MDEHPGVYWFRVGQPSPTTHHAGPRERRVTITPWERGSRLLDDVWKAQMSLASRITRLASSAGTKLGLRTTAIGPMKSRCLSSMMPVRDLDNASKRDDYGATSVLNPLLSQEDAESFA